MVISFLFILLLEPFSTTNTTVYPTNPGTTDTFIAASGTDNLILVRREVYGDGRIFDISHTYTGHMSSYGSENGLGEQFLRLPTSMKNGSFANICPGLLIDVPREINITAEVMEPLHIPKGMRRALFRTLNTDRRLMLKNQSDTSSVLLDSQMMRQNASYYVLQEIIIVEGLKL
ncbi:hypothetical protein RCOM_0811610 [Ricinus communis]|uniref:Uncharacterized protein n=1 Tax=Ricinus communis TaxID=3988 RepID=B9RYA7_RICCO|nr:hypothetical protein RCOM_0811610 [Ricinus communis]